MKVMKVSQLPPCSQRLGRFWDNLDGKCRAVLTCGGAREIESGDCIICGGHKVMLKNEVSGFGADDYKLLKCALRSWDRYRKKKCNK